MIYAYNKNELYHHGILGQEWGKRNGPPYPLDAKDHSTAEKKAGWRESLDIKRVGNKLTTAYAGLKKEQIKATARKNPHFIKDRLHGKNSKESEKKVKDRQIEDHRQRMIKHSNNPKAKKYWEDATPEQVEQDLKRKQEAAKKIVLGVAVVGASVAVGLYLRNQYINDIAACQGVTRKDTAADVFKKNSVSWDTANKIIELRGDKDSIDLLDRTTTNDIGAMVNTDWDLLLKTDANLGRVDFHKDFDISKAENVIFADPSESDNEVYKNGLRNFNAEQGIHTDGRFHYILKANDELKVAGRESAIKIFQEMYQDKNFKDTVIEGYAEMLKKEYPGADNFAIETAAMRDYYGFLSRGKEACYAIIAMGGQHTKLNDKIVDQFAQKGYHAILDLHDVDDRVAKLPIILLDKGKVRVHSGKKVSDA